jgi:hypothetical protein
MFFVTGYVRNGEPFLHDAAWRSQAISMAGGVTERDTQRIRITLLVGGKQCDQGREAGRSGAAG